MYFGSILAKAIIFCVLSSVNDKVRMTPLTALESVFVMELVQEFYGRDSRKNEEDED